MKIVFHPGTGTYLDASECMVLDTNDLNDEGFDTIEETLANVDVAGIDLGELLNAIGLIGTLSRGCTVSQFEARA